jgi:lysozyme
MSSDDLLLLGHLVAQLTLEEERRDKPYDDATGKELKKGDTIKGFITIGVGINLSAGLYPEEIDFLLRYRITKKIMELERFQWFASQDVVRRTALLDVAFNLGTEGLLHWHHFIAAIDAHQYDRAADEIDSNAVWKSQVGKRADRIEAMIRTGQWPTDVKA